MAFINKQDTNGTKGTLAEGEFGYDKQGADRGRVYVGTNAGNVSLAKKSEVDACNKIIGTDSDISFTNATVLSTMTFTDGVCEGFTSRTLTPANIGAEPADSTILKDGDIGNTIPTLKATSSTYGGSKMSLTGTTLTITTT